MDKLFILLHEPLAEMKSSAPFTLLDSAAPHIFNCKYMNTYLNLENILIGDLMRGSEVELVLEERLKTIISKAFESVLGPKNVMALRFHVERRLGRDMFDVFYDDPSRFYNALSDFLGIGAKPLMRLIAQWLNENGYLENLDPDEFVRLLERGDYEAVEIIKRSFNISQSSHGR